MASQFNGVKISLLMQQDNLDYNYIAFPTFNDTVNNYEDDATEINQCYISGNCPVSHGIDFSGETLLMVDDLANSNCIINTNIENITKLKYGDFGINVYTENNGTFYDLRGNEGIENKDITYVGYVGNTKKELKLQNQSFWKVVPTDDSDFILTHVPQFKADNGTFNITETHYFLSENLQQQNPHNASNVVVEYELDDNIIEFVFQFEYVVEVAINDDKYDCNFAKFLYKIEEVKINGSECKYEYADDKVTYKSDDNIILQYDVKHNLPNSNTKYTYEDDYSYCHKDHIFEFVLCNNKVSCCVDYCQMSFARPTNLILPKTITDNSKDDYVKSTKEKNDKLIVSLNDSNKTNYTFEKNETPLYNFYNFCNHWDNYYMYKPIDQLTFLKQGNYKFKCYNVSDKEVTGNVQLLSYNHNLCVYDKNRTITTGHTIKLESEIGNSDNWTSRETKISNLEKEIEKYYTQYDHIKNNIDEKTLHPDNLEECIKNIYNRITTDDVCHQNEYRNYESDYNLIYNSSSSNLPENVKDLVKENIFKSCYLYNNNLDNTYSNTYSVTINDICYILKIWYIENSSVWITIAKEGSTSNGKLILIAHPYINKINFINNSGLHSNIPTFFLSLDQQQQYYIDITSQYGNTSNSSYIQLNFSQFLVNINNIEGGSTIPNNPVTLEIPDIDQPELDIPIDVNKPELDIPLEYDIVETEADLVKILSQAFEYRIKELKQSKSSLTDGLYYRQLKNLDESIDPENDWIGEIRFIPDDPQYVDDSKRINEKPLTLSVIYVDELNQFNQIQYYNSKNEYVQCNTTRNFYLGSKESNLETFIKNGVNLSFNATYKSPYYVECKKHSTNSYHLYPILQAGEVVGEEISFSDIAKKYNLYVTNNKLQFKYIAGICQEDLVNDDASITVAMYVCNEGGNYTVNNRYTHEVNKERSVDITEQKEIREDITGITVPLLPTFLYRTGNDSLAKSTSSANDYSITIPKSPSISDIDYDLSTMSLGHIQNNKVYPGSIWNKNLKQWTGDYISVLTNLYKAYNCTQTSEYVSNYAYYKNYSTVYSKDVLVSINPRNVDDCNQYLTIRDFNYVEWLKQLNKYRKDKNNKDSNVNIRVLGTMKNFPLVFNFNYKLPIIDVSLPDAEKNAVHTIYGTNSNTVVSVDTTTLYTLDSNGDPIVATAYPYVPKCEYDKFKLESNTITYNGSKPEKTLNITELLVDNSLKLDGGDLSLKSFANSGKYDVLTTQRRNWYGKKYNEYLTGLPKNQGFIE